MGLWCGCIAGGRSIRLLGRISGLALRRIGGLCWRIDWLRRGLGLLWFRVKELNHEHLNLFGVMLHSVLSGPFPRLNLALQVKLRAFVNVLRDVGILAVKDNVVPLRYGHALAAAVCVAFIGGKGEVCDLPATIELPDFGVFPHPANQLNFV